ncbi:DNA-binding transcriptional LysR family regulator [Inhella inkyongensis]|uniref:DNA-binding transcriptional LysR family regulator n=1 Tax=Inhella inkyongensis TaxID=392593 RepID=A0A840S9W6_9BURK|nr:LysR family transcriptional regulator [Inhella inkyongensis]MBB5206318.1 DNA-binding transcriptional LysR family regulator [Inhella inkyongensis]
MTRALGADRLHLLTVFVAVVDANGFAGAARKLNISPPAVTRAIAELERQLGVRLLTRTTRVVRVTEVGARYVEDCRRILASLSEADAAVSGLHREPRGRLVITAPVLLGAQFVTGIVNDYLQRYPQVSATCLFLDRAVNLMDEGVDVAVRIGELPDSSMQAVRVGQVRRIICAAPIYLKQRGSPQRPEELSQHSVVAAAGSQSTVEWKLIKEDQGQTVPQTVRLTPRLLTTTNDSALASALNGLGLTRLLSYQVREHLESGALVEVLPDYAPPPLPLHLVHREGRYASSKARAFLDLAIERLRAEPALAA